MEPAFTINMDIVSLKMDARGLITMTTVMVLKGAKGQKFATKDTRKPVN